MDTDLVGPIWQRIELSLSNTDAGPEYIELVRLALSGDQGGSEAPNHDASNWALLPGLCCQAAGGDLRWADDIAAAWLMFYLAADLMDCVEDQDEPDSWWAELGPAVAVNVATGLYFGASRALNRVYANKETRPCAGELIEDFNASFLKMCGGQHQDITNPQPTLDEYWQIAENKSGTFFALACRSGARLATHDPDVLADYSRFGDHFGVLMQILDDLEDLKNISEIIASGEGSGIFRSLPLVYTLDVSPLPVRIQLKEHLRISSHDSQAAHEALEIIEQSGVVLYIIAEFERHKALATDYLNRANPCSPAAETLFQYISRLGASK